MSRRRDSESDRARLEVLGHLAAGVAHEINNWFFVIRGFSELSRLDLADDHPVIENLDRIEEAIDLAEGLTRMILECAHPSGDGIIAAPLHPLVKEALKLTRATLPESVRVHQTIASDAPPVELDPLGFFPAVVTAMDWVAEGLTAAEGSFWVDLAEVETGARDTGSAISFAVGAAVGTESEAEEQRRLLAGGDGAPPSRPEPVAGAPKLVEDAVSGLGGRITGCVVTPASRLLEIELPAAAGWNPNRRENP